MILRKYKSSDCPHLAKLFYETVHAVNAKDYTQEQLHAWANGHINLAQWDASFLDHYTVVAVSDTAYIGFGDIDQTGYLDRLYVHKDYQRQGIAAAICQELEHAVSGSITVHASITAKAFFTSQGYRTMKKQQIICHGVALTNYIMKKCRSLEVHPSSLTPEKHATPQDTLRAPN
ncbi:MAG: GNAT family N-acetyltransferase [Lachnospiraceae bacterium]|nr:GNAT family N-acetyltransferase [Lachnospiraceae bacterium]